MNTTNPVFSEELLAELLQARRELRACTQEVEKVFKGQTRLLKLIFVCIAARGHLDLNAVPGTGKTVVLSLIGKILYILNDLKEKISVYRRLQCTPDMANPIGTWWKDGDELVARPGSVLQGQVILADEINRTPPKNHASLLQPMQEGMATMTFGGFSKTFYVEQPWFFCATQNPIEQEGTYPLTEAQLDRFFMVLGLEYPSKADEINIGNDLNLAKFDVTEPVQPLLEMKALKRFQDAIEQIPISPEVCDYAARVIRKLRPSDPTFNGKLTVPRRGGGTLSFADVILQGPSTRAYAALFRCAKAYTVLFGEEETPESFLPTYETIQNLLVPVVSHRIVVSSRGSRVSKEDLVRAAAASEPVDSLAVAVNNALPNVQRSWSWLKPASWPVFARASR